MFKLKFFILILGIFLVLCGGSSNIYPLYLKQLMHRFRLTLQEVNLYGTSINLGVWVAFPMGSIYDRFGPKISCILALFFLSGSYLVLFILYISSIVTISLIYLVIIGFIMGQGAALCFICSLTTNLKNFRIKNSSHIVGLIISNFALSPSIFTSYREYLEIVDISRYFLLISILTSIVIIVSSIVFVNIDNRILYSANKKDRSYEKYKEKRLIKIMSYFNLFLIISYIFIVAFNSKYPDSSIPVVLIYPGTQILNFLIILLDYFGVFEARLFKKFIENKTNKLQYLQQNTDRKVQTKILDNSNDMNSASVDVLQGNKAMNVSSDVEIEIAHIEGFFSIKLLYLFLTMIVGVGTCISMLNNINFISKSIIPGLTEEDIYIFAIMYFAMNSISRSISGFILEILINKNRLYLYLIFLSSVSIIFVTLNLSFSITCLYISMSMAGYVHGGYICFASVFTRKEYGTKNLGKILGFLTTACALGSLIFADFIYTIFYQKYSVDNKCYGKKCYMWSYFISLAFLILNLFISVRIHLNDNKCSDEKKSLINFEMKN